MSLRVAWSFLQWVQKSGGLPPAAPGVCRDWKTIDELLTDARRAGFVFSEQDLRAAFRIDWAMRAHYYSAERAAKERVGEGSAVR